MKKPLIERFQQLAGIKPLYIHEQKPNLGNKFEKEPVKQTNKITYKSPIKPKMCCPETIYGAWANMGGDGPQAGYGMDITQIGQWEGDPGFDCEITGGTPSGIIDFLGSPLTYQSFPSYFTNQSANNLVPCKYASTDNTP